MPGAAARSGGRTGRVQACLLALVSAAVIGTAALAEIRNAVSQKGRAFTPGTIAIRQGEAITFVNDDGDLLHHAYLEDERFAFDTGDQEPGSRALVTFPVKGSFTVQCGIHPRMKLVVQVR